MATQTKPPDTLSDDFESLAERVDRAIAELGTLDPAARSKAMALKTAIEDFHKLGLTRIVRALQADPRGKELLFELVDDPAIHALFLMHGIVRADPRTRVSRVLDMVRPYLQSHGGDVALVDVRDRTAFVQLSGSCNGCSMSATTLRNTVEEALREHVPEIIRVEAVPTEPGPVVIPIESLGAPGDLAAAGWVRGPRSEEIEEGRPVVFDTPQAPVLLLRLGQSLQAFRNACAHMGMTLDGGPVDVEDGTITCPWHGFRYDGRTGECLTAPQAQLEVFPLRIHDGHIWVRPQ